MANQKRFLILLIGALIAACTPALPKEEPTEVYYDTLSASQDVLAKVKGTAEECRNENARAQAALQEARRILAEAKKLENHCNQIVRKIPKPKPKPKEEEKVVPLIVQPKKETKEKVITDPRLKPNIYNTQNLGEPMFSPSDAPDFARPPEEEKEGKAEEKKEEEKHHESH